VPLRLYATTGRGESAPRFWQTRRLDRSKEQDRINLARLKSQRGIPWNVQKAVQIDEVLDHPLIDRLNEPNEFFDLQLLIHYIARSLDVIGAAYIEPVMNGLSQPAELWPLPSYLVYPLPGAGEEILRGYSYLGRIYKPDELVRWRYLSLRDPYLGQFSPTQAAFEYAGLHDDFISVQQAILEGGPRPDAVISTRDPMLSLGKDERKRLEMVFNRKFSGGRTGRVVVDGRLATDRPVVLATL